MRLKCNLDIRDALKKNNIRHWELADALGISQYTLCVWLRRELPDDRKSQIFKLIEELSGEGSATHAS